MRGAGMSGPGPDGDVIVEVGRVAGTHGTAGRLKVAPLSGDPAVLVRLPSIVVRSTAAGARREAEFAVRSARRSGSCAVLLLEGIDSVEAARRWAGAAVFARRSDFPPAAPGEYYCVDLVGCEVVGRGGGPIGVVTAVVPGPAHDWLEIRRRDGPALLPLVGRFVLSVDVAARRVTADPPEGW